MVIERAQLPLKPGSGPDFEQALPEALEMIRAAAGCRSVVAGRGVEEPDTYVLLVEWDSVQAHTDYTTTEQFKAFGGLIAPFFAGPPAVLHFELLD